MFDLRAMVHNTTGSRAVSALGSGVGEEGVRTTGKGRRRSYSWMRVHMWGGRRTGGEGSGQAKTWGGQREMQDEARGALSGNNGGM